MGFHNMGYIDDYDRRQPWAEILRAYLMLDLLSWLLVAVVVGRIYMILLQGAAPAPFWDGLAFGGIGLLFAYHYLGIFAKHYLAPFDLIAVLYVGRFVILSWKKMRSSVRTAVSVLAFIVLVQNTSRLTVFVFSQKNVIHGKSEIAGVIEARYRSHAGSALGLFFPFASPYEIAEFAVYLNYRGVPVEGVTLAARTIAKDRLWFRVDAAARFAPTSWCFEKWTSRCHAVNGPDAGDLVVLLPDDKASLVETSVYQGRREPLFSYHPFPPIPQWLNSLILSYAPNRHIAGMDGSVTIWK
jgi:hypothetical protein